MIALLGPALASLPIDVLRVVAGGLLLIFGLQWLRKAILRAAGYRALHDEASIYAGEVRQARLAGTTARTRMDWYAFTVSFKSVLLEGLEVVFIVLTFGAIEGTFAPALLGAALAVLIVVAGGVALRAPLSRVPENALKFVVGAILTTFGMFWSVEGMGIDWPLEDGAIPLILLFVLAGSVCLISLLKQMEPRVRTAPDQAGSGSVVMAFVHSVLAFWADFVIGDDWALAAGVVAVLALARVLDQNGFDLLAWTVAPIGVLLVLTVSLGRAVWQSRRPA
jgi:uncharacterized membrane protein